MSKSAEEWEQLQDNANVQRATALAAFHRRFHGQEPRVYHARDLAEAMQRTNKHVEPEDSEHRAARDSLLEGLQLRQRTSKASRRSVSISSSSTTSRSISSDDDTRVVPPPAEWTIPGRTDREHVSSVGDRLLGAEWRHRLVGPEARRFHVRRIGCKFGQRINNGVRRTTIPEPLPVPPPDPTAQEVLMEDFRLRSVLADIQPDRLTAAAEFMAEARWTCGEQSHWRAFIATHWRTLEQGIIAPADLQLVRQRLHSRLLVVNSAVDATDSPDSIADSVEHTRTRDDAIRLWRSKLLEWNVLQRSSKMDVLPAVPTLLADPGTGAALRSAPPTTMRLCFAMHLAGLDLTVLFAASPDQLVTMRNALEMDLFETLRPRTLEPGADLFQVRPLSLEFPGILAAHFTIAKGKATVAALSRRMETALLDGNFSTRHTRDALLNVFAVPSYSVRVSGALIEGLAEVPAGWRAECPKPLPHAPKFLDLQRGTAIFAPPAPTDEVSVAVEPRPPPNFLESVWKPNASWDTEARTLPPYGTEAPRQLHAPTLLGRRAVPSPRSNFRLADGSLAPEGFVSHLRRANGFVD